MHGAMELRPSSPSIMAFVYSCFKLKCADLGDEESVELTRLRILESGALGLVFRESAVDSVLSAVGA